jgi:hypothetical protein
VTTALHCPGAVFVTTLAGQVSVQLPPPPPPHTLARINRFPGNPWLSTVVNVVPSADEYDLTRDGGVSSRLAGNAPVTGVYWNPTTKSPEVIVTGVTG